MSMMQEFKDFALKGNVMDLAVGVIIGGAFGKIVDSIVNDLIMPVVGKVIGGVNFTDMFVKLSGPDVPVATLDALKKAGGSAFAYGNFFTILVNFIILAFIIFMLVRAMNKMKKSAPPAPAAPPEDVVLLREIRDALKK